MLFFELNDGVDLLICLPAFREPLGVVELVLRAADTVVESTLFLGVFDALLTGVREVVLDLASETCEVGLAVIGRDDAIEREVALALRAVVLVRNEGEAPLLGVVVLVAVFVVVEVGLVAKRDVTLGNDDF